MAAVLDAHELATRTLLAPTGLDDQALAQVLGAMHAHRLDLAELYFQWARDESWSLEDGIVKEASHSIDCGVGVRAVAGERAGLAYTDDLSLSALLEAAKASRAIVTAGGSASVPALSVVRPRALYLPNDPIDTVPDADKVTSENYVGTVVAAFRQIKPQEVKGIIREVSHYQSGTCLLRCHVQAAPPQQMAAGDPPRDVTRESFHPRTIPLGSPGSWQLPAVDPAKVFCCR